MSHDPNKSEDECSVCNPDCPAARAPARAGTTEVDAAGWKRAWEEAEDQADAFLTRAIIAEDRVAALTAEVSRLSARTGPRND